MPSGSSRASRRARGKHVLPQVRREAGRRRADRLLDRRPALGGAAGQRERDRRAVPLRDVEQRVGRRAEPRRRAPAAAAIRRRCAAAPHEQRDAQRTSPGSSPSAAILVSTASASVSPSPTASHGVSPRRNARANSQNITQPVGISSASGLTPPEIHANTGCHAQISAASSAAGGVRGTARAGTRRRRAIATPASSADDRAQRRDRVERVAARRRDRAVDRRHRGVVGGRVVGDREVARLVHAVGVAPPGARRRPRRRSPSTAAARRG